MGLGSPPDQHTHGLDGDTWRGMTERNSLPDLNPSGSLFFDLDHGLCIMNPMFAHAHSVVNWLRSHSELGQMEMETSGNIVLAKLGIDETCPEMLKALGFEGQSWMTYLFKTCESLGQCTRSSAKEADWGGCSSFQNVGSKGVCKLPKHHIIQPPWESLLSGAGKEGQ